MSLVAKRVMYQVSSWYGGRPLPGGAESPSNTVPWAQAYLRTKWHLDPSSRLVTIHGPKSGGGAAVPLFLRGGGDGSHLTQCRLGRSLHPYQVAS